jgi:signal transduction histidine kinase/streptogramin lyase
MVLCCLPAGVFAADEQNPHYTVTTWAEKDGLPSSQIRALVQTQDGFLWLGTASGLVRFDGVSFMNMPELPDGDVTALCASRDGSLWIAVNSRVARYQHGALTSFAADEALAGTEFTEMIEDHDGVIWAGGRSGLFRFRDNRWERIGPAQRFPSSTVTSLYIDRRGDLFVGSISPGLSHLKRGADAFEQLASPPRVHGISVDPAGAVWVADYLRGYRRITVDGLPVSSPVGNQREYGYRMTHDRRGQMWVATQGTGLVRIGQTNAQGVDTERFTTQNGLAHNVIGALLEDREGNIWVGTTAGLSRLSEASFKSELTSGRLITSLAATADGAVWASTSDGLIRYDRGRRTTFTEADGLPGNYTTTLFEDSHQVLWVGTDRGIARFSNGRFVAVPTAGGLPRGLIRALAVSADGTVLFSDLDRGLFRMMRDGSISPLAGSLVSRNGRLAVTDGQGAIWLGFQDGGVARIAGEDIRLFGPQDGVPGGRVNALVEVEGRMWIATDYGLSRLEGSRFVTLARNRLPGKTLSSIAADRQGYVWLGTNAGIIRLGVSEFNRAVADPLHQIEFQLYDVSDGAPGAPVILLSRGAVTARNGTIWIATGDGIAVIDPERLPVRRMPPKVLVENVAADHELLTPTSRMQIAPGTSRLEIDFTALTLSASWVRFRYILEGFDQTWVDAGTTRHAVYTNLQPGEYRFRVAASNKDGVWSQPAEMTLTMAPVLYQTRAFYGVVAIAVLLAGGAVWRLRWRAVQRRFMLVFSERTRVAREIHDTLLQSLVGVALQLNTIAQRPESSPDAMRAHLATLRKQVERFIREARQSIWNLRSPALAVHDLPTALREACQTVTDGTDVRFELVVIGKSRGFAPRVEEQLLRIGQEAVSNAVRHANANVVCLELQYAEQSVLLRVSDDGCGFDPAVVAAVGNHWGLRNMEERAQQIGGKLTVVTRPGSGTVLETTAPVTHAA